MTSASQKVESGQPKPIDAHADTRAKTAALVVGIAFIVSVLIVTWVDDFLLANFVVPGDTDVLAQEVKSDPGKLRLAIFGYLLVLLLDSVIGIALYFVLKPVGQKLALLTGGLRLAYAITLILGLAALASQWIDVYGYASVKTIGYVFFALHIFVLGYAVFVSGYIPKILGALLILASFTYVVFFIDLDLPDSLSMITMLTMATAELALSIWLIVKRNGLVKRRPLPGL